MSAWPGTPSSAAVFLCSSSSRSSSTLSHDERGVWPTSHDDDDAQDGATDGAATTAAVGRSFAAVAALRRSQNSIFWKDATPRVVVRAAEAVSHTADRTDHAATTGALATNANHSYADVTIVVCAGTVFSLTPSASSFCAVAASDVAEEKESATADLAARDTAAVSQGVGTLWSRVESRSTNSSGEFISSPLTLTFSRGKSSKNCLHNDSHTPFGSSVRRDGCAPRVGTGSASITSAVAASLPPPVSASPRLFGLLEAADFSARRVAGKPRRALRKNEWRLSVMRYSVRTRPLSGSGNGAADDGSGDKEEPPLSWRTASSAKASNCPQDCR